MSIKSDHWIQRMAKEQAMITPFESGQVREQGGNKMISYGTSSYGTFVWLFEHPVMRRPEA
mgnify:CR=1 FL=1